MKACIVRPHHAGLFSLINNVVTCLSLYDYVHVDWSEGCIYGDAWPYLFEPNLHPLDVQGIGLIDTINSYPHQALTYKNAGLLYQAEDLLNWREAVYLHWSRLTPLASVVQRAIDFTERYFGEDFVAVLVRNNVHAGEQLYDRAQTAEQYREALRPYQALPIYVAAGDTESLQWFDGFQTVTHPGPRRANNRDTQFHLEYTQTIEDAIQCFVEVLIMSHAKVFVHPVSNMATAALYMNPEMKSVFLA